MKIWLVLDGADVQVSGATAEELRATAKAVARGLESAVNGLCDALEVDGEERAEKECARVAAELAEAEEDEAEGGPVEVYRDLFSREHDPALRDSEPLVPVSSGGLFRSFVSPEAKPLPASYVAGKERLLSCGCVERCTGHLRDEDEADLGYGR